MGIGVGESKVCGMDKVISLSVILKKKIGWGYSEVYR